MFIITWHFSFSVSRLPNINKSMTWSYKVLCTFRQIYLLLNAVGGFVKVYCNLLEFCASRRPLDLDGISCDHLSCRKLAHLPHKALTRNQFFPIVRRSRRDPIHSLRNTIFSASNLIFFKWKLKLQFWANKLHFNKSLTFISAGWVTLYEGTGTNHHKRGKEKVFRPQRPRIRLRHVWQSYIVRFTPSLWVVPIVSSCKMCSVAFHNYARRSN